MRGPSPLPPRWSCRPAARAGAVTSPRRRAAQGTIPTGFVPPEGPWHHCIDGDIIPEHPLVAVTTRALPPVPILAGTTKDEWRAFDTVLTDAEITEEYLRTRARALLGDGALLEDVLDLYRGEHTEGDEIERRRAVTSALVTDFHFGAPTDQFIRAHAAHGNKVFRYELRWPSPRPGIGACHDTCLPLLFGTMDAAPGLVGTGPEVTRMSETVQDAWITFIRGADPWPVYEVERRTTMLLGRDSHTVENYRRENLAVFSLERTDLASAALERSTQSLWKQLRNQDRDATLRRTRPWHSSEWHEY